MSAALHETYIQEERHPDREARRHHASEVSKVKTSSLESQCIAEE